MRFKGSPLQPVSDEDSKCLGQGVSWRRRNMWRIFWAGWRPGSEGSQRADHHNCSGWNLQPLLPLPLQHSHSRRRQLIDWTCGISSRLGLTTQTVHLAVRWEQEFCFSCHVLFLLLLRYLDKFMSGHDIKEPQLYLVCCGSVLLASKVCERESNIPRLSTLTALLPVKLSVSDLHSLE